MGGFIVAHLFNRYRWPSVTKKDIDKARRRFLQTAGAGATMLLAGCPGDAPEATPAETEAPTATPQPDTEEPPESPSGQVEQLDAYPRVRVAAVSELSTGDVIEFDYPLQGQSNFLTKLGEEAWEGVGSEEDIVAFNSACTHAGCSVAGQVVPEGSRAGPCPCHYTSFDISKGGLVNMGQATSDLPQIELEVEDGDIYATYVEGLVWGYHNNLRDGTPIEAAQSN
jgi:arsenite oxidase small subunit